MMLAVGLSAAQAPCVALMWTNRPFSVDEHAVAIQAGDTIMLQILKPVWEEWKSRQSV